MLDTVDFNCVQHIFCLFAFSFGLFHGHTVLSQSYHHSGQSTQVISEGALTCAADNTDNRNSSKGI